MPQICRYYLKSKTKVIDPTYRPPNNPLKLFNAKIPINQLVVDSIPTAGTKFTNKINNLHDLCENLGVQPKVINISWRAISALILKSLR